MEYNFKWEYISRRYNEGVDALSRKESVVVVASFTVIVSDYTDKIWWSYAMDYEYNRLKE